MNQVTFLGRVASDVTTSYVKKNDGKECAIAKFSLAVDDGFGENKKTNFFNLTAFYKNAEFVEKYVRKGQKYMFSCHAANNNYTDKNGVKRYEISFIIDSIEFASSSGGAYSSEGQKEEPSKTSQTSVVDAPEQPQTASPSPEENSGEQEGFYDNLGVADLGFLY